MGNLNLISNYLRHDQFKHLRKIAVLSTVYEYDTQLTSRPGVHICQVRPGGSPVELPRASGSKLGAGDGTAYKAITDGIN